MVINKADLSFNAMNKRSKTTLLILHHAAGNGPVTQIHDYHKNTKGWSGIGYHFYVRKDGSVWQGRPIDSVGAHTVDYNSVSVGVCFEGNFENETMSAVQIAAGAQLVTYIRGLYPTITDVKRHGELKNTACPGAKFPFNQIAVGAKPKIDQKPVQNTQNRIKQFQLAAVADGFLLKKYGADGKWGAETESVAKQAICKRRQTYKYPNLTKIVQKAVGVEVDGKFGAKTEAAVIAYQRKNALVPDGDWGINCWRSYLGVR